MVSNDSILWQRLFDAVEGITKEQLENRHSTDGYLPGSDLPSNMREMIQSFLEDRIKDYKRGRQPEPNRENPLLKGLGISQQMSLSRHQLVSLEDFKNVTKKEVLAVSGIGKKP